MFLVNSRYPLVTATLFCSIRRDFTYKGHPFSRSYGANLPSSLTRVISSTLGFSPRLPVSVYGTVNFRLKLRGFSWKHRITEFVRTEVRTPHHISTLRESGFTKTLSLHACTGTTKRPDQLPFSVPPSHLKSVQEY